MGRPPIGKEAMSDAERQRRRRAKLRDKEPVTKYRVEPEIDFSEAPKTWQQKLDAAIRQHQRRLDQEFERRVTAEVKRRMESAFPHWKASQDRAEQISASYTPRFSKKDCNDVARCLHSDTWQALNVPPELASRLKTAFITFTKMQKFLCVE